MTFWNSKNTYFSEYLLMTVSDALLLHVLFAYKNKETRLLVVSIEAS